MNSVSSHTSRTPLICFNPSCKTPLNRIFNEIQNHATFHECQGWIIGQPKNLAKTVQESNGKTEISFGKEPMECVLEATGIRRKCLNRLDDYINKMRVKILVKLEQIEAVTKIKIEKRLQSFIVVEQKIQSLIQEQNVSKINEMINGVDFLNVAHADSMIFLSNLSEIESKIEEHLGQIEDRIFCKSPTIKSDLCASDEIKKQLQVYLKDPTDDHNKKVNKIGALFKLHNKDIYQKKQKVHITQFISKCPICPFESMTEKRKQLMGIWTDLSQHMMDCHIDELAYCYEYQVSGKAIYNTNIDEIVYKMCSYDYEGVEFVCRRSRKCYNFTFKNRKKFSVDVINKGEASNLPIKYIVVQDMHEFYLLFSSVAYLLQQDPRTKHKKVYVWNSLYSEVAYIRKICELLRLENVVLITESAKGDRDKEGDQGRDRERERSEASQVYKQQDDRDMIDEDLMY